MDKSTAYLLDGYPAQKEWLLRDAGPLGPALARQYEDLLTPRHAKLSRWCEPGEVTAIGGALRQLEAASVLYRGVLGLRYGIDGAAHPSDDEAITSFQANFLFEMATLQGGLMRLRQDVMGLTDIAEAKWLNANLDGGLASTSSNRLKLLTPNKRLHDVSTAIQEAKLGHSAQSVTSKMQLVHQRLKSVREALSALQGPLNSEMARQTILLVGRAVPDGDDWCRHILGDMQKNAFDIRHALPHLEAYLQLSDEQLRTQGPSFSEVHSVQAAPITGPNVVRMDQWKRADEQART